MIKKILDIFFFNTDFEKKLENTYKILENNDQIKEIYKLKEKLQNIRYNYKVEEIDNIFPKFDFDIYLSLNQFIYSRLVNKSLFTSKLMFAMALNKKFSFPLPKIYLKEISKKVKVNYFLSTIFFYLFVIIFFFYQFFLILKSFLFFFKRKKETKKIIYIDSVPNLFSDSSNNDKCLDFFKWTVMKFEIKTNLIFIHSNYKIKNKKIKIGNNYYETRFLKNPIAYFLNFSNILYFTTSLIKTIFIFFKIIIFHKTELLLLIKEIYFFYLFKDIKENYNLCLFNNSNMVFRPPWTYINEKKIEDSVFVYFYSTNQMPLLQELTNEKYYEAYGYSLHTWKNYVTWSEDQEKWLNSYTRKENKYFRTAFIPFEGKYTKSIKKKKILTIFDVPPHKIGIYYLLNNSYNIYTLEYCKKFVEDIIKAIPENLYREIDIIFKIKKREHNNIHPLYKKYINEITSQKNIKLISDISAGSIIDMSDATISIPFTSTAITAHRKGKYSIYYDPSEKLSKNNCLENDVELITSFKELESWIANCFKK